MASSLVLCVPPTMIHTDDVCSLGSGNDILFLSKLSKRIRINSVANVDTGPRAVGEHGGE